MPNDTYSQTTIDTDEQMLSGSTKFLSLFIERLKEVDMLSEDQIIKNTQVLSTNVTLAKAALEAGMRATTKNHEETPLPSETSSKLKTLINKVKSLIEFKYILWSPIVISAIVFIAKEFGIDYLKELIRFLFQLFF